jgi:hypothetical protein
VLQQYNYLHDGISEPGNTQGGCEGIYIESGGTADTNPGRGSNWNSGPDPARYYAMGDNLLFNTVVNMQGATVAAHIHIDGQIDRGMAVAQNTIFGGVGAAATLTGWYFTGAQHSVSTVNFYNNIVHLLPNNEVAAILSATGTPVHNHNWNNYGKWPNGSNETLSGYSLSANEINADPLFTNAAGADFTLTAGSSSLTAGSTANGMAAFVGAWPVATVAAPGGKSSIIIGQ